MAEIREIFLRIPKRYNDLIDRIAGKDKFPYLRMKDGFYWVPGRDMKHFLMDLRMEVGNLRKKGFFKKKTWKSPNFNFEGSGFVFMVDSYDPSMDGKHYRRSAGIGPTDFPEFDGQIIGSLAEAAGPIDPNDYDPSPSGVDFGSDAAESAKTAGAVVLDAVSDGPQIVVSASDLPDIAPEALEAVVSSFGNMPELLGGMGEIMEFAPDLLMGVGQFAAGVLEVVANNAEAIEAVASVIFGILEILGSIDF